MRIATRIVGAFLALLGVAVIVICLVNTRRDAGYDFNLRMNELSCLRSGVDPFLVWNETVALRPYVSNSHKGDRPEGCDRQVNAYVPWEYAMMLPLSFLPRTVAWWTYFTYLILCWLIVHRVGVLADRIPFAAHLALLVVTYPLFSDLQIGNFTTLVLTASVLMAWFLNRGSDVAAGFCWSVAMVKPQLAIPLAVPLIMGGKWRTGVVAAGTCVLLSFVPKIYCRSGFLDLLRAGPAANVEFFQGCGTCPYWFCSWASSETCIGVGLIIGLLLCVILTFAIRKEKDWFLLLMPAAVCGCVWSYAHSYCHAMGWFLAFVLVRELVRNPRSKFLWTMLVLSAFVLSRWFLAWHGLCAFAGWQFPMSEYAFRCVDSLNSTASLMLAAVFCVWKGRRYATAGSAAC